MKNDKINTNINMYKIKSVREAKYVKRIALNELESDALAIKSAKEDVKVARKNLRKAKEAKAGAERASQVHQAIERPHEGFARRDGDKSRH